MKRFSALALRIIPFLLLCLAGIITAYALFWFGLEKPYREFDTKEQEAIPLFDSLNKKVLDDLPPLPPGTQIVRTYSEGIVYPHRYWHGRRLNVEGETTTSAANVEKYYKSFLLAKGWKILYESNPLVDPRLGIEEGDMSYLFVLYRGTSCIEINTPPIFSIVIWQDFEHQTFIPPLPNSTYRWLRETGMGLFMSCIGK